MKIQQYESIEKSINDHPTTGVRKSTYMRMVKILDNSPKKIKIVDFVSALLEEGMDRLDVEIVPREEQGQI